MAVTRQSVRAAIARRSPRPSLAVVCSSVRPLPAHRPAGDMAHRRRSSGLPVPRFVSLKSDRVNVRAGPNKDQDVRWVYTRAGMPVEITAEFENWRRIRDWEGAEGWVYHSLLSGKRTALVVPKTKDELVPLYDSAGREVRAWSRNCRPACSARSSRCDGNWCRFAARASTAGSSRSASGASIRTRRWTRLDRQARRPSRGRCERSSIGRSACIRCDSALLAQPHDHVDARDLVAFRRRRRLADDHLGARDVDAARRRPRRRSGDGRRRWCRNRPSSRRPRPGAAGRLR